MFLNEPSSPSAGSWLVTSRRRRLSLLALACITIACASKVEEECEIGTAACPCMSEGKCKFDLTCQPSLDRTRMMCRPPGASASDSKFPPPTLRASGAPAGGGSSARADEASPGGGSSARAGAAAPGGSSAIRADRGMRGDRMTGLWWAARPGFKSFRYMTFSPDGRFYPNKPLWRADGTFDFEATVAKRPDLVGRYRVDDGALFLSWPGGKEEERRPLVRDSEAPGMAFGKPSFRAAYPCTRPLRGRFRSESGSSAGPPADPIPGQTTVGLDIFASTTMIFRDDGTFSFGSESGVSLVGNAQAPGGPRITGVDGLTSKKSGRGTFSVRGLLLRLTFDDGAILEDVFQCYRDDGGPFGSYQFFIWGHKPFFKK
jgi:hypothetical protein